MWQDRRILELLDIEHPIVLAPMASVSGAELVGAVSEAGGLGSFGAAPVSPQQLHAVVGAIRQRTSRPFNVNLFAAHTEDYDREARPGPQLAARLAEFHAEMGLGPVPDPMPLFGPVQQQLDVLVEQRVPVVSFHFGADRDAVSRVHAYGGKVLCSATTVAEARILEDAGVDAVIAQGAEAGGHRGTFAGPVAGGLIGTLALVPQVVDAVSVPVIAAGGIMDGRGIVACLALGASAVQMGTAFLGCTEAPTDATWRAALRASDGSSTTVTEAVSGKAARGIRTRYIEEVEALDEALPPYPAHYSLSRELRKAAIAAGNADFTTMWSGQGVGLIRELPAADLMCTLVSETAQLMKRMGA